MAFSYSANRRFKAPKRPIFDPRTIAGPEKKQAAGTTPPQGAPPQPPRPAKTASGLDLK